jgi:type IX secretion system PorP/SprF family membrane protein
MNKIIGTLIGGLLLSGNVLAQQMPQYSQYIRNQYMLNPGAAGIYDFTDITLSGRWQWLGFDDSPKTSYLSFATVLGEKSKERYNPAFRVSQEPVKNPEINTGKLKHAVGGQILADQYGAFRRLSMAGTYAVHLPVTDKFNLSFGTKLGLSNNAFLHDKAVVLNPTDPFSSYSGGDAGYDTYVSNQSNKYIMDLGAGLYLYSKNAFVGIAGDNLTKDFAEFGSGTANFNTQIHLNATGGVKLPINTDLSIMPAFAIKFMQPAPISIDASIQLEYKEWMWAAFTYRHTDAIVGMFGLNLSEKYKFGYSYDYSLSRLNTVSSGGHELVLGIMLGR